MPNELTFTDPQAWKDIYGHRQGHPQFHKDRKSTLLLTPGWYLTGEPMD